MNVLTGHTFTTAWVTPVVVHVSARPYIINPCHTTSIGAKSDQNGKSLQTNYISLKLLVMGDYL